MTEIWIDAQLSPALAAWINRNYEVSKQSLSALWDCGMLGMKRSTGQREERRS